MRILLVEANDEISEAIAFYRGAKKNIDCKVNNRGHEGLESIRKEKFDLILLDFAMPDFSGKDVIQSFTKDQLVQKNCCHLYRFIRSGGLGTNEKILVSEILKKPFSLEKLTELIQKYRPHPE